MTQPLFRFTGTAREVNGAEGYMMEGSKSIGVSAISTHAMDAYDKVVYALDDPKVGTYWSVSWLDISQVE